MVPRPDSVKEKQETAWFLFICWILLYLSDFLVACNRTNSSFFKQKRDFKTAMQLLKEILSGPDNLAWMLGSQKLVQFYLL